MDSVSDEILGAYIDDELDADERAALQERLAQDAALRQRVCELWHTKQMLRSAFPLAKAAKAHPKALRISQQRSALTARPRRNFSWMQALAASLLLLFGSLAGWQGHAQLSHEVAQRNEIEAIRAAGGRAVVHLLSDEPARMRAALQKVRHLAELRDEQGNAFRVELLVNGPALQLFRKGSSPFAEEVDDLRFYDNLRLVACGQAIRRLEETGAQVVLLPGVERTASAEVELATLLTRGWRYVQS